MTDLLKSAFSYLSSAAAGTPKAGADQGPHDDTSFVGQVVDISKHKLRIRKTLAEGGFGIVYIAQDVQSGKDYTIKRMFAHEHDRVESVISEINLLRKLTGHVNIVEFIAAASDQDKEFLILTEFCSGGALVDHLQKQRLETFPEVLQVFYQVSQALRHLHSQNPPIIHRDMKIENLLLSEKYFIKLIDFGSATTSSYYPDSTWTGAKRSYVEDEMTRNTTPMYRPPEILDLYQNFPINESIDIWALGCVLYILCFGEHPYSDSSKLRIVNANYPTAPMNADTTFTHFHDLIRGCFMVDPRQRPKVTDILDRLAEFAEAMSVPLAKPLRFFANRMPPHEAPRSPPVARSGSPSNNAFGSASNLHAAASGGNPAPSSSAGGGFLSGQLMNQIKGGAGSIVKNIKDASTKVVDVVSSSVTKTDLDISPITSRIIVMSQPSEGVETVVAARNNIDEVRAFLDAKFYGSYAVFNLSAACKYRHVKFDNRVFEAGWNPDRIPPLAKLFSLCHQIYSWLSQKQNNVIVVHCLDGRSQSPIAVSAFLCFVGAFDDASNAAQLFVSRRGRSPITPSMVRYCQYIARLRGGFKPHDRPFSLSYIVLKSVPIVNRQRTGCRPYIEVYCGDQLVHTSQRDYDSLRQYSLEDKIIHFPLNVNVFGDVTILIYHARSTITDRMQGKLSSIKVCQFQFHTGFFTDETTRNPFDFDRGEVDLIEQTPGAFKPDFGLVFELHSPSAQQFNSQRSAMNAKPGPWVDYQFSAKIGPELAFSSPDEMYALTKGLKSGRGRRYEDNDNDGITAGGLLDDSSDGSATNSPAVAAKQHHPPPERPPAPALPPRPDFPFHNDNASSQQKVAAGSQFFDEAEKPELPSRPRNTSDFQADFSIFSPSIDTSMASETNTSQNQPPLVDIWPGDPTPAAAPVNTSQDSGHADDRDSNSLFDIPVERMASGSSNTSDNKPQSAKSENPFLVDFGDSDSSSAGIQPDLFGMSSNQPAANQPPPVRPTSGPSDDLFALFTPAPATPTQQQPLAETEHVVDSVPILMPSMTSSGSNPQLAAASKDPFASILGDFQASKKQPMGAMARPPAPIGGAAPQRPPVSVMNPNAYHRPYSYSPQPQPVQQQPAPFTSPPNANRASPAPTASRVAAPSPTKDQLNQQPVKDSDPFAEIFGNSSKSNKPTTMGDMRKDQLVKDNDPEVVTVRLWAEGKTNNIRALLSTLDQVLWDDGRSKWEAIPIHMLVKASEVKRAYRRAVVVIHPDKLVGTPNERIARLIFVELNEAWSEFEKELAAQQLPQ